jgi:hypothetical protein
MDKLDKQVEERLRLETRDLFPGIEGELINQRADQLIKYIVGNSNLISKAEIDYHEYGLAKGTNDVKYSSQYDLCGRVYDEVSLEYMFLLPEDDAIKNYLSLLAGIYMELYEKQAYFSKSYSWVSQADHVLGKRRQLKNSFSPTHADKSDIFLNNQKRYQLLGTIFSSAEEYRDYMKKRTYMLPNSSLIITDCGVDKAQENILRVLREWDERVLSKENTLSERKYINENLTSGMIVLFGRPEQINYLAAYECFSDKLRENPESSINSSHIKSKAELMWDACQRMTIEWSREIGKLASEYLEKEIEANWKHY